jgi:hypothetical protein
MNVLSERTEIYVDWVLKRLARDATADPYTENGTLQPVHATVSKVKLLDRTNRIELIGKHAEVGTFKDTSPPIPPCSGVMNQNPHPINR